MKHTELAFEGGQYASLTSWGTPHGIETAAAARGATARSFGLSASATRAPASADSGNCTGYKQRVSVVGQ